MSLEDDFFNELSELQESGAGVPITLTPGEAFMLISQLQLAIRHPGNTGPASKFARTLALNLQKRICEGRPAMAKIAEQGWKTLSL